MQMNIDIFNSFDKQYWRFLTTIGTILRILNNDITGAKSGENIPVCNENKLLKV